MFEGQLQTEVSVRFPVGACLLLCGWFTYPSVNSATEKILLPPVSTTRERNYISSLCPNSYKEKGEKKDEGNNYYGER